MEKEVGEYMATCQVCTRNKVSQHPPTGLLRRLPVPHRPWSDISLDFVTGLPPSESNTTILTVVDRFSKMMHFVPLPKLPSAKKTAKVMSCFLSTWVPEGRGVRLGAAGCLSLLEGPLLPTGCYGQPHIRLPSTVQQPD